MDPLLRDALDRLKKLEGIIEPLNLPEMKSYFDEARRLRADTAYAAGVPVSNSPTANGYVPFFVNGKRINLLTGS